MKRTLIGVAAIIGITGASYAYLTNEVESSLHSLIDNFNASEDHRMHVAYDDLDIGLFDGSVNMSGIVLKNRDNEATQMKIARASAEMDFWSEADIPSISGGSLAGVDFDAPKAEIKLANAGFEGVDLESFAKNWKTKEFTTAPVRLFELDGLELKSKENNAIDAVIESIRFETENNGKDLVVMAFGGLKIDSAEAGTTNLGLFSVRGGDIELFAKFLSAAIKSESDQEASKQALEAMADDLAAASLNYGGVKSFEMSDFAVSAPNGFAMSIDEVYFRDLQLISGLLVGGKFGVTDFFIPKLAGLTPQFDPILEIAEQDSFRMNVKGFSEYDETTSELKSESSIILDDLISISSDFEMQDVDLAKMAAAMKELQKKQIEAAFDDIEVGEESTPPSDPAAELNEMINLLLDAYTGYYSSIGTTMNVEDRGLNTKFLNVYAAMAGATPDQLRAHFGQIGLVSLSQLLGTSTPTNLQETLQSYLAEQSVPFTFSMKSNSAFDADTVSELTAENWHTVFDFELAGATQP